MLNNQIENAMTTLTIDNKEFKATERIANLFNRHADDKRTLGMIKMMAIELGELIEIK